MVIPQPELRLGECKIGVRINIMLLLRSGLSGAGVEGGAHSMTRTPTLRLFLWKYRAAVSSWSWVLYLFLQCQ